jgi:hypothetical protein
MGRIVGLEFDDGNNIVVDEAEFKVEPEAALEVTEVEPEAVEKKGSK